MHKFLPHSGEISRKAALAAMAANDQGKFWEFHDLLFQNQRGLDDAKILEIAAKLKLDLDRFKRKMADPAVAALIDKDVRDAKDLDVRWTPQPYVNGKALTDLTPASLFLAIDSELKKK